MKKSIVENPLWVVALAVFCNILWGSAYPGIKLGYEAFQITTVSQQILFAGIRFVGAGLMVLAAGGIKNKKVPVPSKSNIPIILIMAIVYTTFQYIFFYIGLANTTGTNGSIVNSASSAFISVILAHFVYKNERLNSRKIIGTIIGFIGMLVVTLAGAGQVSIWGEGCVAIAALCLVIGSMIGKNATKVDDSFTVTGYNLFTGGVILVIIGLCTGARFASINLSGVLGLAYLMLLSAGAYTIWTYLLMSNPISKISVYNFIIPVSAAILSAIFLNENIFDIKYLVSLVLVCSGIIIVNKTDSKKALKG